MGRQPVRDRGGRAEEVRPATEAASSQVLCALSIVGEGPEHRKAEGAADFVRRVRAGTNGKDRGPPRGQSQNFDSPLRMGDSLQGRGNHDHYVAS